MATQTITLTSWAGGRGFVNLVYNDANNRVSNLPYANNASGPATIDVYAPDGSLEVSVTLQVGASGVYNPVGNQQLKPDGSLDGWRIDSRGPAA
jgi:hypothetical protein